MKLSLLLTIFIGLALLIGCAAGPESVEPNVDAPPAEPTSSTEANADATDREMPTNPLLSELLIYFDFDQSDIRPEFTEMLVAHGQYLTENAGMSLRLEGHADERGTREYNVGLGERRAQAVRRTLLLQGASVAQLNTLSFGEERPGVLGSNDTAWSQNRRVEFVYE